MYLNESATRSIALPDTVYRGRTVCVPELNPAFFEQPLRPGSEPIISEDGTFVDSSGNEWGVYMSDNFNTARATYARAEHGEPYPDSPRFNLDGERGQIIRIPIAGIVYEIQTAGTDTHLPRIHPDMISSYNNDRPGNEWVASVVPAANYRVLMLRLGADVLHPASNYIVDGQPLAEVLSTVKGDFYRRVGRLAFASQIIHSLPKGQRSVSLRVHEALAAARANNAAIKAS